jgi:catechol 2,3-dioxygenase
MNEERAARSTSEYGIAPHGFRLPGATRLGPVRLQVSDLDRSLDYYEGVIGHRVASRGEGQATLTAHGEERPLIVLRERRGATPAPMHGRLGLYHFAILLPARGDLGRFLRHLAQIGERAGASDHYVSEALYLHDPDGLGIEIYADRPRSAWQTNGRELRIGTVPMDTEAVLKAGGDGEWQGLPAGTTIGHLHLHVGDLDEAAAFYHEALGLDRITWSYPGALFLGAGGYHHHLGVNTWAARAAPADEADAQLLEWTVELPDPESVAAAGRSLSAAGYPVEGVEADEIVTADPWGTRLRLRVAGPEQG